MDALEERLSQTMPHSNGLCDDRMERRKFRRSYDGTQTLNVLPGMLLAANGSVIRSRGNEPSVDSCPGGSRAG